MFVPYAVTTVIYWIFFKRQLGLNVLIKNILCIDYFRNIDGTMWYMSFLLLWYSLFCIVFYFDFPIIFKCVILFGAGYYFMTSSYSFFESCAWQFSVNAFSFPIGVLIGYLHGILNDLKKNITVAFRRFIIIFCILCYIFISFHRQDNFGILGILLFLILYNIFRLVNGKKIILYGVAIGTVSYPMYLFEGKIMDVLTFYIQPNQNKVCFIITFLFVLILLLLIYRSVVKIYFFIENWYNQKKAEENTV